MICAYSDRYYADKGWWRRWCWLEPDHDGTHFTPAPSIVPLIDEVLSILGRHIDRKKSFQLAETRALVNVRRDIQSLP
mgnify:CR=1 FL=1